jgi:LacI family transcriptional regulator
MVTIYDVAAKAGVSAATVSRVFNGIKVRPDMTEAVRKAADELGFVPNRMARRLRTSSSEIIAMMIPDIENPFFTVMTRAVEDIARAKGYSVMLCNTDEDPQKELDYLRVAVSEPVAGVILAPSSINTRLDLAIERGVPVVCVDRHAANVEADTVVADNLTGATGAARLLFEAGYHRVACISGPEQVETADLRQQGWAAAYRASTSTEPPAELVVRTSYTVAGGADATRRLLALPQPPDAIFAANNKLASGVIRVLAAEGRLPPTVGLVSFGGLPLVLLVPVGVMVTHLPARRLGEVAATMLLERIEGLTGPAREVVLPLVYGDEDEGMELIDGALATTTPTV